MHTQRKQVKKKNLCNVHIDSRLAPDRPHRLGGGWVDFSTLYYCYDDD